MSLSTLLHSSGVAVFGYALYFDMFVAHMPKELIKSGVAASISAFPGKWKYLTIWNLVLQVIYHSVGLTNDVMGTKNEMNPKQQSWLQKVRDWMFASWAFPVGSFVSGSFWILFCLDRELVYPAKLDSIFPAWWNHAVHTGPIIFMSIGHWIIPRIYPKRAVAVKSSIGLSVVYSSWVTAVSIYSGVWPYPILEGMTMPQRIAFISSSGVIILGIFFVGESMNRWLWSSQYLYKSLQNGDKVQNGNRVKNGDSKNKKKVK